LVSGAWVVAAICLLLALLLVAADQPLLATAAGIAAFAAASTGAVRQFRRIPPAESAAPAPEGGGPYVRVSCKSRGEFVQTLGGVVAELRQAAEESQWQLDWEHFNRCQQDAEVASRKGDQTAAVRAYAHALSFMMNELRKQEANRPGDASA
jgi:hypothetical protein